MTYFEPIEKEEKSHFRQEAGVTSANQTQKRAWPKINYRPN